MKSKKERHHSACGGMTLIEVVVAMALTALLCAGLFAVGLRARRIVEYNRLATEARELAKERLEQFISVGRVNLGKSTCALTLCTTNLSTTGSVIVRQPRLVWHAADGTVTTATNSVYVEAHVDVAYKFPLTDKSVTDTYSMVISE